MIKVYVFNKSNNISRVYDFRKFFQCIDSEISLTHCTDMSTVYQNMPNSQGRLAMLHIIRRRRISDIAYCDRCIRAWSICPSVCLSVTLFYSCTLLKPLDGMRWHLAGTLMSP